MSTEEERRKAATRLQELTQIVNQCIIRRTSNILNKYLPVKFEMVVCVRMSDLQIAIYKNFLKSDVIKKTVLGKIFICIINICIYLWLMFKIFE